jgi:hypothetical protein
VRALREGGKGRFILGEYSSFKPADDWGHSDSDGEMDLFDLQHAFGPSVPAGYPRGFHDEPDMGVERFERSERRGFFSRLFGRSDIGWDPAPPQGGFQRGGQGGQGGFRGAPVSPGVGGAQQALAQLQRSLRQAHPGDSNSLSALQQSFDNFRNALKSAFPNGGPHGAVG